MCGQLVPISLLSRLSAVKSYLHLLEAPGFTRQERHKASDKIHEYPLAMDHHVNKYVILVVLLCIQGKYQGMH